MSCHKSDSGLAFVAFSELLASIPFTPFWSVIFFLTLFCIGVDYQISMIRSFFVAIEDAYGSFVKNNFLAHQIFALIICLFSFLVTLIFLTRVSCLKLTLLHSETIHSLFAERNFVGRDC